MKPGSAIIRRHVAALLLGAFAALAQAMPGADPAANANSVANADASAQTESLACLVLDEQAPTRLKLSADQFVEWQRLRQLHAQLFGDRCQSADASRSATSDRPQTASPRTMQVYRKDFLEFLSGLSDEQRTLLEDAARTRRDARAALEEKVLRHRLML